jgi:hypothetical protein
LSAHRLQLLLNYRLNLAADYLGAHHLQLLLNCGVLTLGIVRQVAEPVALQEASSNRRSEASTANIGCHGAFVYVPRIDRMILIKVHT